MIPNNPIFTDDTTEEDFLEILPEPPKSSTGTEALAIGGEVLDGGSVLRRDLAYWSLIPVGSGIGFESRFELRRYDSNQKKWFLLHSLDAQFSDSALITDLSFAFDKYNHLFATYKDHTGINIFWFDTRVSKYNTNPFYDGVTPYMFWDGGSNGYHTGADVIFLFARDNTLQMRNSSEFFTVPYQVIGLKDNLSIKKIGLTKGARLQITFHKVPIDFKDISGWAEKCKVESPWAKIGNEETNIVRCRG
tara:strand:+ start:2093 stop:2836 length:744 start_codon:yes stop_codon:yes gene_type:complete